MHRLENCSLIVSSEMQWSPLVSPLEPPATSLVETRALMASRLISLLHGRALVRPSALHLLAALLNAHISPLIVAAASSGDAAVLDDASAAAQLLRALCGHGAARVQSAAAGGSSSDAAADVSMADALAAAGLAPLAGVSARELANFVQGASLSSALIALRHAWVRWRPIIATNHSEIFKSRLHFSHSQNRMFRVENQQCFSYISKTSVIIFFSPTYFFMPIILSYLTSASARTRPCLPWTRPTRSRR
jgi:hypothetical protein